MSTLIVCMTNAELFAMIFCMNICNLYIIDVPLYPSLFLLTMNSSSIICITVYLILNITIMIHDTTKTFS